MISLLTLAFLLACLLSGLLTAVLCRWGPRWGLVDHPDEFRKSHARPTPVAGGLAIYLATAILLGLTLLAPSDMQRAIARGGAPLLALLAGSAVIVLVGLIDDRVGLRGRQKLAGQIAAALVVISGGLIIRDIDLFGWEIQLGLLSVPFTLFWLLGAVNSLNLLDGIDGLVSTIGFILIATIAVIAAKTNHIDVVVVAVVFAGSILGFLWFNFPPARIFLGDTGSMLIGLMIGSLVITGSCKTAGTVLLAAPLAVCTIPILDCGAAILRRKLTGRSIYVVDHGHLHHRLMARLGSNRRVLAWVGAICLVTCLAGLASVFLKHDLVAVLTCTAVVVVLIVTDIFGRMEARLLVQRLFHAGASIVRPVSRNGNVSRNTISRLQGTADWEHLWEDISEATEQLEIDEVALDVHLPMHGESFSATMRPDRRNHPDRRWQLSTPITVGDQVIGKISFAAPYEIISSLEDMERALTLVDQVQDRVPTIAGLESVADEPTPDLTDAEMASLNP